MRIIDDRTPLRKALDAARSTFKARRVRPRKEPGGLDPFDFGGATIEEVGAAFVQLSRALREQVYGEPS